MCYAFIKLDFFCIKERKEKIVLPRKDCATNKTNLGFIFIFFLIKP